VATEFEKKKRLLRVFNLAIYGLAKGLWDLFGESSFATTTKIGDEVLTMMEKETGLEIQGENPEDILIEINRLLVDEIGTMSDGEVKLDGNKVSMSCTHCFLRQATMDLEEQGVQPFACVPMTLAAAAMRRRLGTRHRILGREWEPETETCTISFELVGGEVG
jgi:hypothetical protein